MARAASVRWLAAILLLAILPLLVISGCGGGGTGGGPTITLKNPLEDATKNGSIGGTIFTLAQKNNETAPVGNGIIDQAYNATITLSGTTDHGQPYSDQTSSMIRGGYEFANVPPGTYTVTAEVKAPYGIAITLTGDISGVRVRGNIPTLMANIMACDEARSATIKGTVTGTNGQPATGATVSVDISGYSTDYLQGDTSFQQDAILSETTDSLGAYSFRVPIDGTECYIAVHSDNSQVDEVAVANLQAGETRNLATLQLLTAVTPLYPKLSLDLISTTLPAPTALASTQAMITQLAVARALRAPQTRITRLEKMLQAPRAATRAINGIVENDLYWLPDQVDTIRGFFIYRGAQSSGNFTYLGSAQDPYEWYFFDNDPALAVGTTSYYTVASYAASGRVSPASAVIAATPLPQIAASGPPTAVVGNATVTWQPVNGAQSYVVTKYATEPTYNSTSVPLGEFIVHTAGATSENLALSSPGTYWWSVSAYNTTNPNLATAASFSSYTQIVLTSN